MNIIGNKSSSHAQIIKGLAFRSDELILVSPFCYSDFSDFFQEIVHEKIKSITLITTIKNDGVAFKANALSSFIDVMNIRKIAWKIQIDNRLHGKLYFFKNNNEFTHVIITSANLTENGMIRNHEWGYIVDDINDITALYNEVMSGIEIQSLSEDKVRKLMIAVDEFHLWNPPIQKAENIDLSNILQSTINITWNPEIKIFLKPYGHSENKIFSGDFSKEIRMYFSRRRPNSVKVNDILICYAVGPTKIVSIFKVMSEPINTNKTEDRWPWFVEVHNLTMQYGQKWSSIENTLSNLSTDYLSKSPENYLTYIGGKTLGAFQFGADKIRLNDDFGKFIIDKVMDKEKTV